MAKRTHAGFFTHQREAAALQPCFHLQGENRLTELQPSGPTAVVRLNLLVHSGKKGRGENWKEVMRMCRCQLRMTICIQIKERTMLLVERPVPSTPDKDETVKKSLCLIQSFLSKSSVLISSGQFFLTTRLL